MRILFHTLEGDYTDETVRTVSDDGLRAVLVSATQEFERTFGRLWCADHKAGIQMSVTVGQNFETEFEFAVCCRLLVDDLDAFLKGPPESEIDAEAFGSFSDVYRDLGLDPP